MAIEPFTAKDFEVFAIPGFAQRMAALRTRVRPKLEALGTALGPAVTRAAGRELHAHVARHARRTVNPPEDTRVAFGPDPRGYKKASHFKIAVSRHALRFLFEVGPEHAAKGEYARAWRREAARLRATLGSARELGWFRNEHGGARRAPRRAGRRRLAPPGGGADPDPGGPAGPGPARRRPGGRPLDGPRLRARGRGHLLGPRGLLPAALTGPATPAPRGGGPGSAARRRPARRRRVRAVSRPRAVGIGSRSGAAGTAGPPRPRPPRRRGRARPS